MSTHISEVVRLITVLDKKVIRSVGSCRCVHVNLIIDVNSFKPLKQHFGFKQTCLTTSWYLQHFSDFLHLMHSQITVQLFYKPLNAPKATETRVSLVFDGFILTK